MRFCAIGDACVDYYTESGRYYPTGNAVNVAVHVRRLGLETALVSAIGKDAMGDEMASFLEKEQLDLSYLLRLPGDTAVTMMDLIEGERLHGEYREGVLRDFEFASDQIEFARSHDFLHSAFWGRCDGIMDRIKTDANIVSFDFADRIQDPLVDRVAPWVDYAFFSYKPGQDAWIERFLARQVQRGVQVAVATFGDQGSMACTEEGFFLQDIVAADVVNTVGAGDAFIAGFMHSVATGAHLSQCLDAGARLAAQVVSRFDPY